MTASKIDRAAQAIDRLRFAVTALVPDVLKKHQSERCCTPTNPCMLYVALEESTNNILLETGELLDELRNAPKRQRRSRTEMGASASRPEERTLQAYD